MLHPGAGPPPARRARHAPLHRRPGALCCGGLLVLMVVLPSAFAGVSAAETEVAPTATHATHSRHTSDAGAGASPAQAEEAAGRQHEDAAGEGRATGDGGISNDAANLEGLYDSPPPAEEEPRDAGPPPSNRHARGVVPSKSASAGTRRRHRLIGYGVLVGTALLTLAILMSRRLGGAARPQRESGQEEGPSRIHEERPAGTSSRQESYPQGAASE
ncbi:hypothetical protein BESB_033620 [Besnoitia besnoiti]|uniref:Dense granule protein GRA6 n=1 Tax=Besnoitia besnoiti TaxID=94643 RepID=A0A2A9MI77_BESBE|nr:hypothetical protein BESB_033620 [Besnoitia besnoiti]PFH36904.1 hypothetical protein BESB_033620 [Besnoitia besnoiti]